MIVKCIIVEDEPVSQDVLIKYIGDTPVLSLVRTCNNAFEAKDTLLQEDIHLMFLDINMPKLSGMNFLRSLAHPPLVIFTTAYPEYALESYEVNAIDYLLKPFSFPRFTKAVNKALDMIIPKEKENVKAEYILLKADKKIHNTPFSEITHLEAMGDYVKVHLPYSFLLVHGTLQSLLKQLPEDKFIQVHKSYIISFGKIDFIEGNEISINDTRIPVGGAFKNSFLKKFQKLGNSTNERL
jgi:DNA-binding LytR/AlgR family response regulator